MRKSKVVFSPSTQRPTCPAVGHCITSTSRLEVSNLRIGKLLGRTSPRHNKARTYQAKTQSSTGGVANVLVYQTTTAPFRNAMQRTLHAVWICYAKTQCRTQMPLLCSHAHLFSLSVARMLLSSPGRWLATLTVRETQRTSSPTAGSSCWG